VGSYGGQQHKGRAQKLRAEKRAEAEGRNALTPPERRRAFRLTANKEKTA
jgi:hypothetical protein